MTPILLSGITVRGFLAEALTCVVTEERNGVFELELTYPVSGLMFPELCTDRLIKAKPNDTADCQLFRIYQISKPLNGIVIVSAEHISYALSHYPVAEINMTGITATQAINAVLTTAAGNLASPHGFSVGTTDMTALRDFSVQVCSARAALGGVSGSVLDAFGGEFEFDNYIIRLHTHRGSDTGVIVSYGKNLTDVKLTTSTENSFTALFPYCLKDDVLTVLSERRLDVENTAVIAERVLLKDFTSLFESGEEIIETALRDKAAAWLAESDINSPTINMTVSFIHLWQSPEYASFAALEKVSLCDWVTVRNTGLGIDIKAQVIKTVYDTLGERYQKIELGSAKANFADTLRHTTKQLEDAIKAVKSADTSAITHDNQATILKISCIFLQKMIIFHNSMLVSAQNKLGKGDFMKRSSAIDVLKVLGCFGVVFLHVIVSVKFKDNCSPASLIVYKFLDPFLRTCVPVFFMCSGYFMIGKYRLTSKNIIKCVCLLIYTFVFTLISLLFEIEFVFRSINIKDFIVRSIFGYYHLWFIFVLIGLYLITPVLSKIAESNYSAVYFIIVFLLFNSFLISIPKVSVFSSMIEYLNQYKILIAGGYSGYFMLGYFLRNGINKKAEIAVAIAGVVSYFLVVSLSFVHLSFDWDYASYLSLPIVFLSCSVFCFFTKAESKIESKMMLKKLISFYQPLTLYIYFIHIIATDAIRKYDYLTRRNNLITVAIYTVLIILLCSLISWMFVKIKSLFFKKCVPVLLPGRRDRI